MHDRQPARFGTGSEFPERPLTEQQFSSHQSSHPGGLLTRLGLPQFGWSLTLLGLCIITSTIVTYYVLAVEIGIVIAAVGLFVQDGKIRVPFPLFFYAGFVLWAFLGSFLSMYSSIALPTVIESAKLLVIMFIAVNALRTEGQIRFYLMFLLGCFVLFPVRGALLGSDSLSGRVVWNYVYNNPNDLATLLLVPFGVALGFMFSTHTRILVRLGGGISAILMIVVILLTQSRGAVIGVVIGMGPALVVLGLKRPVRLLLVGGILAVVVGVSVPVSVWERLAGIQKLSNVSTIAEADTEGSAGQRFEIQKVGWQIFKDNPVIGIGLGAYPLANAMYAPNLGRRDTHNTYLNLVVEVGVPGFLLWCALVWSTMRYAYRVRQLGPPGELATLQAWMGRAFVAYLVAGMFGTYSKLTFPYLILAVLWCSAYVLSASVAASQEHRSKK
jgi:hypothetical protein